MGEKSRPPMTRTYPANRRENVYRYVERATGAWTECPLGIAARELEKPPRTYVQEVASDEPGVRIFIAEGRPVTVT
jgi:hypothetical protein